MGTPQPPASLYISHLPSLGDDAITGSQSWDHLPTAPSSEGLSVVQVQQMDQGHWRWAVNAVQVGNTHILEMYNKVTLQLRESSDPLFYVMEVLCLSSVL